MLLGLMDHWVPTVETISRFWKLDLNRSVDILEGLLNEVPLNNFTFYTKWYTNGIYSQLPFLKNHPDSSNVRTKNEWGRELIKYLHRRGLTTGAMLQLYTYESSNWGKEMVLAEWDVRSVAATDGPNVIADFTDPRYRERLAQIIEEHLRIFPELDYLFLEFEGVSPDAAKEAYRRWTSGKGKTDPESVDFSGESRNYCNSLGIDLDFCWSLQAKEMFTQFLSQNIAVVQKVLNNLGWQGTPGLVYHNYGYESRFFPEVIPNRKWWLLPWHYWGWEQNEDVKEKRQQAAMEHMRQMKASGYAVCCLGDATISPWDLESLRRFLKFTITENLDGYLGMGNPASEPGMRWLNVTEEQVNSVRKLFAQELRSLLADKT